MIFVLGGGPSLTKAPLDRLRDFRCISVNNAYRVVPWAEVVWFGDLKWWRWYREDVVASGIPIASCCSNLKGRQNSDVSMISMYGREAGKGITEKPGWVRWNGHSGGSAINFAYHLGAKTIVLVGFDMRRVAGQKNWHTEYKESLNTSPFRRHLRCFPRIKQDADALGLKIINATPDSAITSFPIVPLEEALDELL